ncbi:Retinol dehydrogenase 10-A [Anabarilius grahami]|uniref:Retinol dehydrogenase 10-A n=1 Tax=Anabarilius grahami TaxID=495550 RepID=A0A3N0YXM2_ANAGA|nr:Retinol dehydrogenase 10-A [Anabarilius grahami]
MIFLMDLQMMLLDVVYFILRSCLRIVLRPRTKPIDGELVLITGSGGALGRLFALEFSKHGAEVVLWDFNRETNEETAKMVRAQGGQAHAYTVDVTNREEVYRTADQVRKEVGRDVTYLVNNAGVVAGERLLDCPDTMVERTLKVNCHALFWVRLEEVELVLPPLEPLYCVQQAMNAILIDQPLVCIPRLTYLPFLARALLPWESNVATYRFMGSDQCMYPFIETMRKKKAANGPIKAA